MIMDNDSTSNIENPVIQVDARQRLNRSKLDRAGIKRFVESQKQNRSVNKASTSVISLPPVTQKQPKKKVASYCRVSSLLETQQTSIESQRDHYESFIISNPDWDFVGTYLEEGVTGTKAEIRPELQRMIADCKDGKIDLIITKSISRFSRNTQDCLELVRLLTSIGVDIWFEKENLRTDTLDSEFLLTILAWFAEYESESISGNIKWAIRKRFENGTYKQSIAPYGYLWDGDSLVADDSEAQIVHLIYKRALSGKGSKLIADELNAKGIPSPFGKTWSQNSVRIVLTNPAYIGNMLYQKTFKDRRYRQRKNRGELNQYLLIDHHQPLVEKIMFDKAKTVHKPHERKKPELYAFTGILTCAECGSPLYRESCNKERPTWICHRHKTGSAFCSMKPESETDLKSAFINCLNKLALSKLLNKYDEKAALTDIERKLTQMQEIEDAIDENQTKMDRLMAEIIQSMFLPEHREKYLLLKAHRKELLEEKSRLLTDGMPTQSMRELKRFVNGWKVTADIEAFPADAFRSLVRKCTVDANKSVTFHFTCGLNLKEPLERVCTTIRKAVKK